MSNKIPAVNWSAIDQLDGQLDGKVEGVDLTTLKAVIAVESSGNGFLPDGRPKILFEGHQFWKALLRYGLNPHDYVRGNEDILFPKWTKKHYQGGYAEYERLSRAQAIHPAAAMEAASWGLGQIMGFNCQACGYDDVHTFVADMHKSHDEHVTAFINFLNSGCGRYLKGDAPQMDKFFRCYNGPGYRENQYPEKYQRALRMIEQSPQEDFKPAIESRRNQGAGAIATGVTIMQSDPTPSAFTPLKIMGYCLFAVGLGLVIYSWWDDRRKGRT